MKTTWKRSIGALAIGGLPLLFAAPAMAAGAVKLNLTESSLLNVSDSAGLTQQETGTITNTAGTVVGYYQISRRDNTGGTGPQSAFNSAATQIVLMFATSPTNPIPHSVTVEGAWDFTNGIFSGSVSSTSERYSYLRGADASVATTSSVETLTLTWNGQDFPVP